MLTRLLHAAVAVFQGSRRIFWFFTRPETTGVHGIPITREGKVVLVQLSYAAGWRLPGGGLKLGEDGQAAMLRELREEIGLKTFDSAEAVTTFEHRPDHRKGRGLLFVIRGAEYEPKWSLEVRRVGEFDLDALPADTANITHQLLALASPLVNLGRL